METFCWNWIGSEMQSDLVGGFFDGEGGEKI